MEFIDFARSYGLVLDHIVEGRWVRVATISHKRKRNGAYKYLGDVGFVQEHSTMADVAVWRPDATAPIDHGKARETSRRQAVELQQRHSAASSLAEGMLGMAEMATHPYLIGKGFPKETGLVLDDELLIPMRDVRSYKTMNTLQRISPTGDKLFLSGGKAKDSVFFIGPFMAKERWLVEGYATGLSVKAALNELRRVAQVVVCFSAGNMASVGRWASELKLPAYVFADHDKSGAGEKAARDSGLQWVMAPEVGDANDWHQKHGLRALVALIRGQK